MLGVRTVEELVMEGSAGLSGMKVLRLRVTLVSGSGSWENAECSEG
jgi:hypothetical protein